MAILTSGAYENEDVQVFEGDTKNFLYGWLYLFICFFILCMSVYIYNVSSNKMQSSISLYDVIISNNKDGQKYNQSVEALDSNIESYRNVKSITMTNIIIFSVMTFLFIIYMIKQYYTEHNSGGGGGDSFGSMYDQGANSEISDRIFTPDFWTSFFSEDKDRCLILILLMSMFAAMLYVTQLWYSSAERYGIVRGEAEEENVCLDNRDYAYSKIFIYFTYFIVFFIMLLSILQFVRLLFRGSSIQDDWAMY